MLQVVHVATQHVDEVVLDEPQRNLSCARPKVACQRENIELEAHPVGMQAPIALTTVVVVVVALGMCQDGMKPLALQVEEQLIDLDELLGE